MTEQQSRGTAEALEDSLLSFWERENPHFSHWELPPPASAAGHRCSGFAFSSRGDRVTGRIWWPAPRATSWPLVLLGHAVQSSADGLTSEEAATAWRDRGFVVAALDLPLHGARWSEKLSLFFLDAFVGDVGPVDAKEWKRRRGLITDPERHLLCGELQRQAQADFSRLLDALLADPELRIDPERIAFAGFSTGAVVGAHVVAGDERIRCAAFAEAGAELLVGLLDVHPGQASEAIAPRPQLQLEVPSGDIRRPTTFVCGPGSEARLCSDRDDAVTQIGAWLVERFAAPAG